VQRAEARPPQRAQVGAEKEWAKRRAREAVGLAAEVELERLEPRIPAREEVLGDLGRPRAEDTTSLRSDGAANGSSLDRAPLTSTSSSRGATSQCFAVIGPTRAVW
jgi:hypothetical protein